MRRNEETKPQGVVGGGEQGGGAEEGDLGAEVEGGVAEEEVSNVCAMLKLSASSQPLFPNTCSCEAQ